MNLILLGPPGTGKGTVAQEISSRYHLPHISTGDIFRQNIKNKTALGQEVESYLNKGDLVPDDLTNRLVEDRLNQEDVAKGFILDGYPRTLDQARALADILENKKAKLDVALNVYVPDEIILKRLAGRRVCESCGDTYNIYYKKPEVEGICDTCGGKLIQREDDSEETVKNRLKTYEEKTAPLISYYEQENILKTVDNSASLDETLAQVKEVLD
jgi:adenylate kinase